ncbi:MAG: hypothetical protein LBN32_03070 [Helicobacteraceae bacterium]|jgi:hypothetical protein|nr:hypothetical protein [Helicobacteraceae bacterium]
MSVTPIGGVIYANQNTPAVSQVQQQAQGRMDFQNMMTAQVAEGDHTLVEQTRPAEESADVNPDREHERQEADEREAKRKKKLEAAREKSEERLLDIKV